jgi:hypothetical protein
LNRTSFSFRLQNIFTRTEPDKKVSEFLESNIFIPFCFQILTQTKLFLFYIYFLPNYFVSFCFTFDNFWNEATVSTVWIPMSWSMSSNMNLIEHEHVNEHAHEYEHGHELEHELEHGHEHVRSK